MKKIAVLGSGKVGEVLAGGFLSAGHEVMRGSREPSKLAEWAKGAGAKAKVGTFEEAAKFADTVVLAVKGTAAESIVSGIKGALAGKTVMDATNPIADAPPTDGVVAYFTGPNDSLMERLQKAAPDAHFVKAYSSVGNAFMIHPKFSSRPTMFICGNDEGAKKEVAGYLEGFGWDAEDMGKAASARAIEPLCQLWCAPGMLRNQWTHAFKLLKL